MNTPRSFAALITAALLGSLSAGAWSEQKLSGWTDEVITYGSDTGPEG